MEHIKGNKPEYTLYTNLFINGEFVQGQKNQRIKVVNPATEEAICEVAEATEEDVEEAVKAAQTGFELWNKISTDRKNKLFVQLAAKLEEAKEEFAYIEAMDNGKPLNDAREDIIEVVRVIRYYAGMIEHVYGKTYSTFDNYTIETRRVPYGVVGCIVPWNYPLLMTAWKIFPAMAAGNSIVLKQSEETPLTALRLASIFREIEFPPGLLNIVTGYGAVAGSYLSKHHSVNKIAFTGSTAVGRLIMKASADSNIKNVHLELGGKSPMVVFSDADITNAVEWVVEGAFRNSSQNCNCGSRLYVEDSIYDQFVKRLVEKTQQIKVGMFDEENVWMGPLINTKQYKNCLNYIQHGKENEKLELVLGGTKSEKFSKGYFVNPTIFVNVPEDSKLAREEIFGPVLVVLKPFKTVEEVLEKCNDTTYGLAAGVFTSDMNKAEYFVRKFQAGSIWVNYYNVTPYNVPFGGMKQSGFGRDNGDEAIAEYTTTKAVYHRYDFSKYSNN